MARAAILCDAARERGGKTRQDGDRSSLDIRRSRQRAGVSHSIHGVNSVAAAALGDVHRIVENRQPAEIVIFPRFVRSSLANLGNFEVANHIDVGRHRRCLVRY